MCSVKEGFILCTCDPKKLRTSLIDWRLNRIDHSKPEQYISNDSEIKGLFIHKPDYSLIVPIEQMVEEGLNQRNCFDFDYIPQNGDQLTIRVKEPEYVILIFKFNGIRWKNDRNNTHSWEPSYTPYKLGKIHHK